MKFIFLDQYCFICFTFSVPAVFEKIHTCSRKKDVCGTSGEKTSNASCTRSELVADSIINSPKVSMRPHDEARSRRDTVSLPVPTDNTSSIRRPGYIFVCMCTHIRWSQVFTRSTLETRRHAVNTCAQGVDMYRHGVNTRRHIYTQSRWASWRLMMEGLLATIAPSW